jgi:hypothetical protein
MKDDKSGRGSGFTRSENEYIVAKCLRAIADKEKIRDIDMAEKLGRGKNNISIRRRALGFSYKTDHETGEIKVIYERPKSKDFYVNIEKLDVNRAIATIEYKIAQKKRIKEGLDYDDLKVSDFYPDKDFENYSEETLIKMSNIIVGDFKNSSKENKENFELDYDESDISNENFNTSSRFINQGNDESSKDDDTKNDKDVIDKVIVNTYNDNKNEDENEDDEYGNIDYDKENEDSEDDGINVNNKEESEEDKKIFASMTFLMTRRSLTDEEWGFFKEKWKEYMNTYSDQFDEVSDWDDLNGYILEQIKKLRLLQKEITFQEDYSKELTLCTTRANEYKKNLATSRMSRIQQKVDTRLNLADLIKLFEDNEKYIELNYQAELELKKVADYIRDGLIVPNELSDFSRIDGNEPALLVGINKTYEELSRLIAGEES